MWSGHMSKISLVMCVLSLTFLILLPCSVKASDVIDEVARIPSYRLEQAVLTIARAGLESAVKGDVRVQLEDLLDGFDEDIVKTLTSNSAGVFVTVVKENAVRACVGSIWARCGSLADEIYETAVMLATYDRRRAPISADELVELQFAVSIVGRLQSVNPYSSWSPVDFGLFVRSGDKTGVILPGEAKTHAKQLSWACSEAGISLSERFEAYRFQTVKLGCSLDLSLYRSINSR